MKSKNTTRVFLTLMALFLVYTSLALAEDQGQHQKGIIDRINHQQHQKTIFDEIKNSWNTVWFYGEVLVSDASYKITHLINTEEEGDNKTNEEGNQTAQTDLDYWSDLKDQFPFSEKPVFISMESIRGPAYDYVPEGVSEVSVMDNAENILDSYTVTKNETGFTIQKGAPSNPDNNYTITLDKLEELDEIYGNLGQVKAGKLYIKEQIQKQA
jgi:hypothetical protein